MTHFHPSFFFHPSSNIIIETPSQNKTFSPPLGSGSSITIAELESLFADELEQTNNSYPATELEWLATTTFNHAVDYYIQEKDEKCREWAEKALALAAWADGSRLRDVLMEKYSELTWGGGE